MAELMRPSPMNATFMTFSLCACPFRTTGLHFARASALSVRLSELTLHPVELAADIVDDVAGLEVVRQHVPGVGLDLELARQRFRLVEAQRVLDREPGGAEWSNLIEKDRNMEMGPPFARPRIFLPSG